MAASHAAFPLPCPELHEPSANATLVAVEPNAAEMRTAPARARPNRGACRRTPTRPWLTTVTPRSRLELRLSVGRATRTRAESTRPGSGTEERSANRQCPVVGESARLPAVRRPPATTFAAAVTGHDPNAPTAHHTEQPQGAPRLVSLWGNAVVNERLLRSGNACGVCGGHYLWSKKEIVRVAQCGVRQDVDCGTGWVTVSQQNTVLSQNGPLSGEMH